jgi:hypothetical protein
MNESSTVVPMLRSDGGGGALVEGHGCAAKTGITTRRRASAGDLSRFSRALQRHRGICSNSTDRGDTKSPTWR